MPTFTCECVNEDGSTPDRQRFRVTSHDGLFTICDYCVACAELATMDWNGETAAIVPATDRLVLTAALHRDVWNVNTVQDAVGRYNEALRNGGDGVREIGWLNSWMQHARQHARREG